MFYKEFLKEKLIIMNLEVKSDVHHSGINKQVFQLKKSRRDGLILQVHHTVPAASGEIHRVRFLHVAFNIAGELLAAADHRGNIFIIDLANQKFWLLPNIGSCTVIAFPPWRNNELLVGTSDCILHIINIELGTVTWNLDGHTLPPKQISFSSTGQYCLTASVKEAIVWNLESCVLAHRLTLRKDIAIKQITFMPLTDNILACFQDDAMYVWRFDTFDCIKQILPETWKSHHLKTIAFTKNGRAMLIGGYTSILVVFSLDAWCVKKVIELPEDVAGVRHVEFLPQLFDGGANKVLGLLSSNCTLHFLDIDSSVFLKNVFEHQSNINRFTCSSNGKYIACVLQSGEVNIYTSSLLLEPQTPDEPVLTEKGEFRHSPDGHEIQLEKKQANLLRDRHILKQNLLKVHKQIKQTLDLNRLRPILKEFGEYPESYRCLIWKTILQLPCNQPAYMSLVKRDVHPAYLHLEEQYPLENRTVLKNLKRLLSCLAHWSPIFAEVKFLPLFVFPFIRVYQNDPFVCFEIVTTVLVNWCQHWFEYFPFPPINVLSMIENVLAEHDSELLEFYYNRGIKSDLYGWTLLEVAFSEVLSRSEWMCLWDHILSNEPSFLLMAVVAYNILCRRAIMSCQILDDFEYFFHNQNPIDVKRFISKTYALCNKTREEIHPRQYLRAFKPLEKGSYPVFNQYPKSIVDYKVQQIKQIRKEEETILKDYQTIIDQKVTQEKRIQEAKQNEVQEKRLQQLEESYREMLHEEEERVAKHRQKVMALRKALRARELELLNATKDRVLRKNVHQRRVALNHLFDDIERKRTQEETELAAAEDEIQRHYIELLSHKQNLEQQLGTVHDAVPAPTVEHQVLQRQQERLACELRKLQQEATSEHHMKEVNIATRMALVDELLQRVEMELAREMAERQNNMQSGQNNVKVIHLEAETKKLELEVDHLLEQLIETRLQEGTSHIQEVIDSQVDRQNFTREQEDLINLQRNSQSSHLSHMNWEDRQGPEDLRHQWNGNLEHQHSDTLSISLGNTSVNMRSSAGPSTSAECCCLSPRSLVKKLKRDIEKRRAEMRERDKRLQSLLATAGM